MPLDTPVRSYTDRQKELWDLMMELVLTHPARDIIDALSDGFLHADPAHDIGSQRAHFIGRELERLGAEHANP